MLINIRLDAAAAEASDGTSSTALATYYADLPAPSHSVQALVGRVNRQIESSILDASYITLFYAEFNEQTATLRYTNAGHNPPLLLRRGSDGRAGWSALIVAAPCSAFSPTRYMKKPRERWKAATCWLLSPMA